MLKALCLNSSMTQKQGVINPLRTPGIADDPCVNHALWVLANVLLEIAKNDLDRDGTDIPVWNRQAQVKSTSGPQISRHPEAKRRNS